MRSSIIAPEPSHYARELARRLLLALSYLIKASADGGAASELHLLSLLEDTIALLRDLGGFDDVISQNA